MFDDLQREIARLSRGIQVPIELPLDEDGYLDRRCPWPECSFVFKVLFEDWEYKVPDQAAFCPSCRHQAEPQDFNTSEQDDYILNVGLAEVGKRIDRGMRASATTFNRRQPRNSFISIRMDVQQTPRIVPVPVSAREAMTLRIECDACSCQYAVIGAAYFCPACGQNSAEHVVIQSITTIRNTIAALPDIRSGLQDPDLEAQVSQRLLEGNFEDLVTAFQRFAEAAYPQLPGVKQSLRTNVFQRLEDGSRLWESAGGDAYDTILDQQEMADLQRFFQQRHLLAHQDGIVDQRYIDHSKDPSYVAGQRLVIQEELVLQFANILEKLVTGMRRSLF